MKVNLEQYQKFNVIPSGTTRFEYNTKIAELFNWDINNLNEDQLNKKVSLFLSELVQSKKEHKHIKLNNRWYKVDRDLFNLKHSQWLYFSQQMKNVYNGVDFSDGDDKKNSEKINDYLVENAHKIIAAFIRPCRLYKWFPKKFDINNTYEEELKDLDVKIVIELTGFFFLYTTSSMNNTRIEYLEKLEERIWERLKE